MSIERIKDLKEDLVKEISGGGTVTVKEAISDALMIYVVNVLLEQEEQKEGEKGNIKFDIKYVTNKEFEEKYYNPVFEVGQIWRNKYDGVNCKVTSKSNHGLPYVVFNEDSELAGTITEFFEHYELVTMENIKEGEWVELIQYFTHYEHALCDGIQIKLGTKFEYGNLKYNMIPNRLLKPCLPPVDKEEKKVHENSKTVKIGDFKGIDFSNWNFNDGESDVKVVIRTYKYTQEDLDKAREEGYEKGISYYGGKILKLSHEAETEYVEKNEYSE